ncbi:MAG: FtsX-like permease family protein [Bryobacter sp.]|jgi:putative ABC transport system permease protein|nr:FtsX-like permease family protein [Bryobacter sp.]
MIPLIVKNSLRNRRRSLLTILSIAASLCLLGVLGALFHAFYLTEETEDQALRLVVRNKVSLANPMPVSYEQQIAAVPGVKSVMIYQWFGGTYKDARDPSNMFARFAVEAEKLPVIYPEYGVEPEGLRQFMSERTACLVGRKLATRMGFKVGDRITLVGDIFPATLELTVRAYYDSKVDNENLLFHYTYLKEAMTRRRQDWVSNFVVRIERPEDAGPVAAAIDSLFRNATLQTKTETEKAFTLSFLAFLGNVKLFLFAICSAVVFTILLVSGNTMAMSVRERVREVGILKTLGFTQGRILTLLLGESVVISLVGGVIGLFLAQGLVGLARSAPSMFIDNSTIELPPMLMLIALGVSAFIGLVSSIVPAWSAARRPIVEALRVTD